MDLCELPAGQHRELADVLDGLAPGQRKAPSLPAGRTVHHVAAHLVTPFRYSAPQLALKLLAARGRHDVVHPESLRWFWIDRVGIELETTDLDWSFGSGARAGGTADDVALALCSRQAGAGGQAGERARLLAERSEGSG